MGRIDALPYEFGRGPDATRLKNARRALIWRRHQLMKQRDEAPVTEEGEVLE